MRLPRCRSSPVRMKLVAPLAWQGGSIVRKDVVKRWILCWELNSTNGTWRFSDVAKRAKVWVHRGCAVELSVPFTTSVRSGTPAAMLGASGHAPRKILSGVRVILWEPKEQNNLAKLINQGLSSTVARLRGVPVICSALIKLP